MAKVRWAVRCTAHSKRTGLPCRAYAISGAFVCISHGGAIGQVRAAAQRRLQEARADRMMLRKAGRPLNAAERSWVTGDSSGLRRELSTLLLEVRAELAWAE